MGTIAAWSCDVAVPREPAVDRATIHAVAREVAALLRHTDSGDDAVLTAAEVAIRFNVDRSWVYAHADELGVIRLGEGPRPRLRFDPAIVAQRLVAAPGRTSPGPLSTDGKGSVPLLPIKRPRNK
jgi:hypothetical protein